jgi:hypothetical protein
MVSEPISGPFHNFLAMLFLTLPAKDSAESSGNIDIGIDYRVILVEES